MSLPRAGELPLIAVTLGLRAWERTRMPRQFAMRRAGELVQIAAHTPLGRLMPAPRPAHAPQAEEEAERIAAKAREVTVSTIAEAAPPTPAETAEKVAEQLSVEEPHDRSDLPIPDFDNITLGSLRARLRSLSLEQLATLREWEQAHAHRLPVTTLLDNRIAKLAAEGPAYPADPQTRP